jgi:hypothetical protein
LSTDILVGHHAHELVATHGGDEREPHPRVASHRFDEGLARPEDAATFSIIDDGECDAVLDAPAGVHVLAFDEHRDG